MANEEDESLFADLMNYRFSGAGDIGGHNLGNLIFLALIDITGSYMGAIDAIRHVLNVKGSIYPSTLDNVTLYAMKIPFLRHAIVLIMSFTNKRCIPMRMQ